MKITTKLLALGCLPAFALTGNAVSAQAKDPIVDNIVKMETDSSQLRQMAHELFDEIGPRLVGTPDMQKAGDWAVAKYKNWGIDARQEKWGEWRGWQRGISHIDMISPRVKTLEGTQLAWSPSTGKKTVTAEVVILPDVADSNAFKAWLPSVKGKFVMISMNQPTGRSDENWRDYGTKEEIEKNKEERTKAAAAWRERIHKTGYTMGVVSGTLPHALEEAGAAGIITCTWSAGFGVDKIFEANTKKVPTVDVGLEDYTMLFRLIESGEKPVLAIHCESKELGPMPTFNVVGEIRGTEKPNEYVILSAHFDSWDGGTGATDNGTGTLTMMEAMRILKKVYPNPKRTILIGDWSSEEEGLNGSRAFVEDHPDIVKNIQAVFNQDNGTGRVVNMSGQGFLNSYDYLTRWLSHVPSYIRDSIKTTFPGAPGRGGSDFASFVAAGAPAFSLGSLSWDYGVYTWHTNRDTYDKIVFDEVEKNAILTAILAYEASEDPQTTSREKSVLLDHRTGQPEKWPEPVKPNRHGGFN
ncbi:MAG TPA: M20/M25/M40 family metallo-hydrolase [Mucilaginibacter sp.]|nr:M20/M25/M40 family metallo-hydrolase [Mucilaginibacter sp.]